MEREGSAKWVRRGVYVKGFRKGKLTASPIAFTYLVEALFRSMNRDPVALATARALAVSTARFSTTTPFLKPRRVMGVTTI